MEPVKSCKFGFNCENASCGFNHPDRTACRYGGGCTRPGCWFNHKVRNTTKTDPRVCQYLGACRSVACIFNHPRQPLCPEEASCSNLRCPNNHEVLLCKFQNECANLSCEFRHPVLDQQEIDIDMMGNESSHDDRETKVALGLIANLEVKEIPDAPLQSPKKHTRGGGSTPNQAVTPKKLVSQREVQTNGNSLSVKVGWKPGAKESSDICSPLIRPTNQRGMQQQEGLRKTGSKRQDDVTSAQSNGPAAPVSRNMKGRLGGYVRSPNESTPYPGFPNSGCGRDGYRFERDPFRPPIFPHPPPLMSIPSSRPFPQSVCSSNLISFNPIPTILSHPGSPPSLLGEYHPSAPSLPLLGDPGHKFHGWNVHHMRHDDYNYNGFRTPRERNVHPKTTTSTLRNIPSVEISPSNNSSNFAVAALIRSSSSNDKQVLTAKLDKSSKEAIDEADKGRPMIVYSSKDKDKKDKTTGHGRSNRSVSKKSPTPVDKPLNRIRNKRKATSSDSVPSSPVASVPKQGREEVSVPPSRKDATSKTQEEASAENTSLSSKQKAKRPVQFSSKCAANFPAHL